MTAKKIIVICLLATLMLALIIVNATFFSVKDLSVSFSSTTINLSGKEEQIIDHAQLNTRENIFLLNKENMIKDIEESVPHAKVISIETVFPNRLIVHIVERDEMYAVKLSDDTYAICDIELKVLRIDENYNNNNTNAIFIESIIIDNGKAVPGYFIDLDDLSDNTQKFSNKIGEWDNNLVNLRGNIKSIEFRYEESNRLIIKMRQGISIIIFNFETRLSDKIQLAFSAYDDQTEDISQGSLMVVVGPNGDKITAYYNEDS